MKLPTLRKLDLILEILVQTDESDSKYSQLSLFKQVKPGGENFDIDKILGKLIDDKYAAKQPNANYNTLNVDDIWLEEYPYEYTVTFGGLVFFEQGGYEKNRKKKTVRCD